MLEPTVLAAAKEYLLTNATDGYALLDIQFDADKWGSQKIPAGTKERLTPTSALTMAAGRPDALIAGPRRESYETNIDSTVTAPLLAVVEAKGHSNDSVAVETALTQAHSHLGEVNIAFAAVPSDAIAPTHRRLARELNLGLLGVDAEENVTLVEQPYAHGVSTTPTTETVRFQAQVGGSMASKLRKNHPKNAIGYALAVAAEGPTTDLCAEHVIGTVEDAKQDATAMGLVVDRGVEPKLTRTGREAVRSLTYRYGTILAALRIVADYSGSDERLIDAEPVMGQVARHAVLEYPPTQALLDVLEELGDEPQVNEVAKRLATRQPAFAIELFLSPKSDVYQEAAEDPSEVELDVFDVESNYHTNTLFQYKAVLFHVGLLTTRGVDSTSKLDFESKQEKQTWALENQLP